MFLLYCRINIFNDVDLVVLNRARPFLVYDVLREGIELKIADKKLYFDLLCKTIYEAVDWWQFVDEYWKIKQKACSLSPETKKAIQERLDFLEDQFQDLERFKTFNWNNYSQ